MKIFIKTHLIMLLALFTYNTIVGQNITITDDQSHTPDSSAMLDVFSTNKGLLVPRLTSGQVSNISDPATGLLVYNSEENTFLYFTGTEWLKLSAGNPDNFWVLDDSLAYLADTNLHFGIGTSTPVGKLEVWGDASIGNDESLFEVKDKNGNTVFAVKQDGVIVYVDEDTKGNIGGFAVSGRSASKATGDYMRVTKDSIRIYIDTNTTKGNIGGFAVSGRSASKKAGDNNIFLATPDSTRIYFRESNTKGNIGGFAVSGRSASKNLANNIFLATPDSTRVYVGEDGSKGNIGGFAVSGRSASKGGGDYLFNVSTDDSAQVIDPSKPGLIWYPNKEALLSGRVLVTDPDSVGLNSMASGFEAQARGDYSQAMGYKTVAAGEKSFSFGDSSIALGNSSFAFGEKTIANGYACLAIGSQARMQDSTLGRQTLVRGISSMAIGAGAVAHGVSNAAIGMHAEATGNFGCGALGPFTKSAALGSMAIGFADSVGVLSPFSIAMGSKNNCGNSDIAAPYSMALGNFNFCGDSASIALGSYNQSMGIHSLALGFKNLISGSFGVSIGTDNVVDGESSIVMGNFASDNGLPGCFMFSDPTPVNPMNPEEMFVADAPNQFKIKATGGAKFVVGYEGTDEVGAELSTSSGGWHVLGSKKSSKSIKDINEESYLQKLVNMPLQKTVNKEKNNSTTHLTPYAEDFYNAFGLGNSPREMSYLDLDGVSFAAIKALEKRTSNLQKENENLKKENKLLRKEIEEIKAMIQEMGK